MDARRRYQLSVTAPVVSEENERQDLEQLSEEERQQIENDIFGLGDTVVDIPEETPESMQCSIDAVSEMITNDIVDDNKRLYLEALQRCPEIVEMETPIENFVRSCRFDSWKAAQLIVAYWETRELIFGPERAFLPMTLDGAMKDDPSDLHNCIESIETSTTTIDVLRHGFVMLLPPDQYGRRIVFSDFDDIYKMSVKREAILRCFFYLLHTASQDREAQIKGRIGVVNFRSSMVMHGFDRIQSRRIVQISESVPMPMRALHLALQSGIQCTLFNGLILPALKFVMGTHVRRRLQVHYKDDVVGALSNFGIRKECIPTGLGGDFDHAMWIEWVENRFTVERTRTETE